MDPSLIDAFTARSLGVPMDEMLRGRRARLSPRRTPYLSPDRPRAGREL
ncbi:hypothetical protein KZX45_01990 [Georgenia sp. EYE_87]|nr:hypothetical protein [Georgenia sp. EYE_87]MCK6209312.1 hypothetical protein [Georgenia sp. EYE_87]